MGFRDRLGDRFGQWSVFGLDVREVGWADEAKSAGPASRLRGLVVPVCDQTNFYGPPARMDVASGVSDKLALAHCRLDLALVLTHLTGQAGLASWKDAVRFSPLSYWPYLRCWPRMGP